MCGESGPWGLTLLYQSDVPTFGAGCILGNSGFPNPINVTCNPFFATFTASVTPYLGATCCGGTVTVTITE